VLVFVCADFDHNCTNRQGWQDKCQAYCSVDEMIQIIYHKEYELNLNPDHYFT